MSEFVFAFQPVSFFLSPEKVKFIFTARTHFWHLAVYCGAPELTNYNKQATKKRKNRVFCHANLADKSSEGKLALNADKCENYKQISMEIYLEILLQSIL